MKDIPSIEKKAEFKTELLDLLEEFGVVKIPGCVSPGDLDSLNQEYETLDASGSDALKDLGLEVGMGACIDRGQLDGGELIATNEFFGSPWMKEGGDAYWGRDCSLNDQVYVTREVPGTKHLAQDLHFDVQETLKFFLYLNDVSSQNGAFSCAPGVHEMSRTNPL